ncbi:hypothetical protein L226DRAFT_556117 [Lentinus tigrinus ALCF2SS1-7]|uniref:Uncharacterized protein n=1 Tax=Lentinus tigrinus ALCF2SS1-6 TaxID=1328759 RepID=A0A5C2SP69_9APHY|nr:hypothetical protein L227DRAFT_598435 [Lentinus tigrinus ALCF2SS1-6]RPD82187.1 hypothetical protein L226DRAFT_556117 [Lentinus tigrinus ALCF2SS1-7]
MSGVQPPAENSEYPEQKHAGAVGFGPEYGKGASTGDKFAGMKEEVKGKILHKPDLVEHGRELRSGVVKKKQMEDDDSNPFQSAQDSQDEDQKTDAHQEVRAATTAPAGTQEGQRQAQGQNTDNVAVIE